MNVQKEFLANLTVLTKLLVDRNDNIRNQVGDLRREKSRIIEDMIRTRLLDLSSQSFTDLSICFTDFYNTLTESEKKPRWTIFGYRTRSYNQRLEYLRVQFRHWLNREWCYSINHQIDQLNEEMQRNSNTLNSIHEIVCVTSVERMDSREVKEKLRKFNQSFSINYFNNQTIFNEINLNLDQINHIIVYGDDPVIEVDAQVVVEQDSTSEIATDDSLGMFS